MLQFLRASEVLHVVLKLGGLAVVLMWAASEAKDAIKGWNWATLDGRVKSMSMAFIVLVLTYAALYAQAVAW